MSNTSRHEGGTMSEQTKQLDDLVLRLKGLALVRAYRQGQGADPGELNMFSTEIDRVRERLVKAAPHSGGDQIAA
jgi:hypothetical protein